MTKCSDQHHATHETFIRLGRRGFYAYCSCGWMTHYSWDKTSADRAMADHDAAHVALGAALTVLADEIDERVPGVPQS